MHRTSTTTTSARQIERRTDERLGSSVDSRWHGFAQRSTALAGRHRPARGWRRSCGEGRIEPGIRPDHAVARVLTAAEIDQQPQLLGPRDRQLELDRRAVRPAGRDWRRSPCRRRRPGNRRGPGPCRRRRSRPGPRTSNTGRPGHTSGRTASGRPGRERKSGPFIRSGSPSRLTSLRQESR